MSKVFVRLGLACFLGLCALEADAQQTADAPEPSGAFTGDVLMAADEVFYDEDTDTITASGNVEFAQGGRVLRADHVRYQRSEDVVTASGDVALVEPSGEVLFADSVELTDDLRNGVISRLNVLLTDDSRIAAGGARRIDGERTVMRKAVYSPCALCPDEPERPPLWQLKANTVVHDRIERSLSYYDASIEVLGLPVFYTPYFRHPDPKVSRHTGFLTPTYGSSTALGAEVEIPYYWNIAPNRDATLTPRITSDEGVVLAGEYRERTRDGGFTVDASITQANTAAEDGSRTRGHLFSSGAFDIDETWLWGFDLERAFDDTYLSRYDISSKDELVTNLFAERYRQRSFMSANAYAFQSLRAGDESDRTPIVFPLLDVNLVSAPVYAGGYATFDANLMVLERLDGIDSRRLSVAGGWHRPFILDGGHLLRVDASLRGDLYYADAPVDPDQPYGRTRSDTADRVVPQLAIEWRYPLVAQVGSIRHFVEPIVQGIISPHGGNPDKIPNEDSRDLEFDHTNLFSTNRFTGFDRIETGQRVNYGVRLGFYGADGGRATALFGQSVREKEGTLFDPGSGLEYRLSDFVGGIFVQPSPLVDLSLRFRLDRNDFSVRRNEIDLAAGPDWLRGRLGFADVDRQAGSAMGDFAGGRESVLGVATTFLDNWTFSAESRRDHTENATIDWRALLTYEDECILIGTGVSRSFTRDRDIQPDTVFHLTVKLINAG